MKKLLLKKKKDDKIAKKNANKKQESSDDEESIVIPKKGKDQPIKKEQLKKKIVDSDDSDDSDDPFNDKNKGNKKKEKEKKKDNSDDSDVSDDFKVNFDKIKKVDDSKDIIVDDKKNKNNANEGKIFKETVILNADEINLAKEQLKEFKNSEKLFSCEEERTKDNNLVEEFHKKCDNRLNTVIIFDADDKGKFICYTDVKWESTLAKEFRKSSKAFIYSLSRKEKFSPKNAKVDEAICVSKHKGPIFGNSELVFHDQFADSYTCRDKKGFLNDKGKNLYEEIFKEEDINVLNYEVFELK